MFRATSSRHFRHNLVATLQERMLKRGISKSNIMPRIDVYTLDEEFTCLSKREPKSMGVEALNPLM